MCAQLDNEATSRTCAAGVFALSEKGTNSMQVHVKVVNEAEETQKKRSQSTVTVKINI